MSKANTSTQPSLREQIRNTFDPWMKSRQALDALGRPPEDQAGNDLRRHHDGAHMVKTFGMKPFWKTMRTASRKDHAVAEHPQALAHLVTHVEKWEAWELKEDDPDLDELHRYRRKMLEWFRGGGEDENRMRRMRTGGSDLLCHGEQGTTKTTFLHWLTTTIMQLNPRENVVWQSSLDDTEWITLAKYATVALPKGIDVQVVADPYRKTGNQTEIEMDDVCRDLIRYKNPTHLAQQLAQRTPGQLYVVYPDPRFRECEQITNWSYYSLRDVDRVTEATDLQHFWFALLEKIVDGAEYNEWTTIIADEAQKFLHQRASSDDHDWWEKVQDWATTWGDARKSRVSAVLACHQWKEIHGSVRDKMRWGATMNGEDFPAEAPINGSNTSQGLGETTIWSTQKWNKIGYPDMKKHCSVPADINVTYPNWQGVSA